MHQKCLAAGGESDKSADWGRHWQQCGNRSSRGVTEGLLSGLALWLWDTSLSGRVPSASVPSDFCIIYSSLASLASFEV